MFPGAVASLRGCDRDVTGCRNGKSDSEGVDGSDAEFDEDQSGGAAGEETLCLDRWVDFDIALNFS